MLPDSCRSGGGHGGASGGGQAVCAAVRRKNLPDGCFCHTRQRENAFGVRDLRAGVFRQKRAQSMQQLYARRIRPARRRGGFRGRVCLAAQQLRRHAGQLLHGIGVLKQIG